MKAELNFNFLVVIIWASTVLTGVSVESQTTKSQTNPPASASGDRLVASYCQSSAYANDLACVGSNPSYCSSAAYANDLACAGSNPSYCSSSAWANDLACAGSNPSYCSSPAYANDLACAGSNPSYCSSSAWANDLACAGSNPSYCSSPAYANDLACAPLAAMPFAAAKVKGSNLESNVAAALSIAATKRTPKIVGIVSHKISETDTVLQVWHQSAKKENLTYICTGNKKPRLLQTSSPNYFNFQFESDETCLLKVIGEPPYEFRVPSDIIPFEASLAGRMLDLSSNSEALNWDEWNFFYTLVAGNTGPAPELFGIKDRAAKIPIDQWCDIVMRGNIDCSSRP